jgi:hypothetical protein
MTLVPSFHEIVVEAPDGAAALALEQRLAHLRPVTISRDNAWMIDFDSVESPAEVEGAVRSWLSEIGSESTLMRVDNRLVRIAARDGRVPRGGTYREFVG